MMKNKIPEKTIGLLSQILPDNYTHKQIDGLFLHASASENIPEKNKEKNKPDKVTDWLRMVNQGHDSPITVLEAIIEAFMEKTEPENCCYAGKSFNSNEEAIKAFEADKTKIIESLNENGLQYLPGGEIVSGGATPTRSLYEHVKRKKLPAVNIEIRRALSNVEKDPMAAVHNAGCVLEASLKAYLNHYHIDYKEETDSLLNLWKKVVGHIGINPKEMDNKGLKKIASGLYNIVDGTMYLRNKKSSAHGRSATQLQKSNIRPRHARLAIHAAHTVSAYILELLDN